ncbi:spinocerebellar ataxia type 10 protein domain-containing protein [Russula earlei]|uniref:Spinocerebellar ataxia type 10 protein domain-containing protein n=1 Tax=Russula earlei TaxID=71964 RepID=A0ACC0UIP7_9AGAM|nr:spinocerebellar ataxia type 10 protein domain-containing protein [Russula earlei]
MHPTSLSQPSQLLHLLSTLQSQNPSENPVLEGALNVLSHQLASDKALRVQLGSQHPSIWPPLHELWNAIARAQSAGTDTDDQHSQLLISLAKFTRNLIADVPFNQKNAYPLEPQIRQLIYLHTAWIRHGIERGKFIHSWNKSFVTTRLLTQTLSNLVTGNEELLDQFWDVHMTIPEEKSVLLRLLGLPDLRSVLSVLVLVINCIHESSGRGHALVTTSIGIRVCISVLDRLEAFSDASELEDGGKIFELGFALFSKLFQFGLFPELYSRTSVDDEPVSLSQTTLLKLLDSFCHSIPNQFRDQYDHLSNLAGFLASVFLVQAESSQQFIQRALGDTSPDHNGPRGVKGSAGSAAQEADFALDGRLPGVWVALVLLSTSLSSILLAEQERSRGTCMEPEVVRMTRVCHEATSASRNPGGSGFIEELIELLRLLDAFLPRVNFAKSKRSTHGKEAVPGQTADTAGFPYLKRDLVRLLGILSHNCKAIQDRIRLRGGIPVVLNLCVVDDRNPYLREHALFALRNLLHDNPENQAVVDTFRADEPRGPNVMVHDHGAN